MEQGNLTQFLMGAPLPKKSPLPLPPESAGSDLPFPLPGLTAHPSTPALNPPQMELLLDPNWGQAPKELSPEASSERPKKAIDFLQRSPEWIPAPFVEARPAIRELLGTTPPSAPNPPSPPPHQSPRFLDSLIFLVGQITVELRSHSAKLLQLNPSRRDAIAAHLERMAGLPPLAPPMSATPAAGGNLPSGSFAQGSASSPDPSLRLRRWLEGNLTPIQTQALDTYLEEVALIALGQAIVLKAWSDRKLRPWSREDLGRLNWTLSSALAPYLPLHREGWQITQKNLYSWYSPCPELQDLIWRTLEDWRISHEGPALLSGILQQARSRHADLPTSREIHGFDPRFFSLIWENLSHFQFSAEPETQGPYSLVSRKKTVFSPTLRECSLVRTGPVSLQWIGFENNPFLLLVGELAQLWWGPAAPPAWAIGNGLEAHRRDQLHLNLAGSPKPSLLTRIAEMEACDLAFVLENSTVRLGHRGHESQRLRAQLDTLPYFKKLRSPGTTLGDLQACLSLEKLRPGALLWWTREEPITSNDGAEVINRLLDGAKLLCEWDLSAIEHQLPVKAPLFPKYLYLFQRELDTNLRHSHRPMKIKIQGQIRSHVEVQALLSETLASFNQVPSPKGNWTIHRWISPVPQRDWAERWPDALEKDEIQQIEDLQQASVPLASVATVRCLNWNPEAPPSPSVGALRGVWVRADYSDQSRSLIARVLKNSTDWKELHDESRRSHAQSTEEKSSSSGSSTAQGFVIALQDETWYAPMAHYIESKIIKNWLDHKAERKGGRWHLTEQIVKFIPIPRLMLKSLGLGADSTQSDLQFTFRANPFQDELQTTASFALPLPGDWEKWIAEMAHFPSRVKEKLSALPPQEPQTRHLKSAVFVRASRVLASLKESHEKLQTMINAEGGVRWGELFRVLPPSEFTQVTLHPSIRVSGTLPPHVPIVKIERGNFPSPGILLLTELGFRLHLGCEHPRLIEMIAAQLESTKHPTWNELVTFLRVPRSIDSIEQIASEVSRNALEQRARIQTLREVLEICLLRS